MLIRVSVLNNHDRCVFISRVALHSPAHNQISLVQNSRSTVWDISNVLFLRFCYMTKFFFFLLSVWIDKFTTCLGYSVRILS